MDNKYTSTPLRNPAIRNHASTNSGRGHLTVPNEGSPSNWMNVYPSYEGAVLPTINAYGTRQTPIRQTQQQLPPMSSNFYSEPMASQSPQQSHFQIQQRRQQNSNVLNSMNVSQQAGAVAQHQNRQQPLRLSQHRPSQQPTVSRSEFPSSQRQHHMTMERNFPQGEFKQSPQAPTTTTRMLHDPHAIGQQILLQSQRAHSEIPPSMVVDSTSRKRRATFELEEEIYQEIKSMKEQYFPNLVKHFKRIEEQAEEFALMSGMLSEDIEKSRSLLAETLQFLLMPKEQVQSFMKDKLPELRRRIIHFTYASLDANTSSSESRSQQILPHFQQQTKQEFSQRLNAQQNVSQGSPQQMRGVGFYMNNASPQRSHPNLPLQRISSPLTTMAPSPLSGYSPSVPTATTSSVAHAQVPSSVIGSPQLTVASLLGDFTSSDSNQFNVATTSPEMTPARQPPVERLITAIQSAPPNALRAAVRDIQSVVDMNDMLACPAGVGNSRGAIGEDLAAMTYYNLQAQNLMSQGESSRQVRDVESVPLNEGFKKSDSPDTYDTEAKDYLLKEIKKISDTCFDMVIKIIEGDEWIYVAGNYGEGTVIQCHLNGVGITPEFRSHLSSDKISPVIMPLRLLVPPSYPEKPPVVLDEGEELDDLAAKARSRFRSSMCSLPQPISLEKLATAWQSCAREVLTEYVRTFGGGTFSKIHGTWETYTPGDHSK